MRFVACEKEKLNINMYKKTRNMKLIEEFIESGLDCVKVEDWPHKDCHSCATALNLTVKRMNRAGIRCIVRKGEVYLVREDA